MASAAAATEFSLAGLAQGSQTIAWTETIELGDSNVSSQGRASALCGLMEYAMDHESDTSTVFRVILQLFASDRFVTKKAAGMLTETCNARAGKGRISQPQQLGPVIVSLTELVKRQSAHFTATTQSDPGTQNFFSYLRTAAFATAGFADILGKKRMIRVPVPIKLTAAPTSGKEYFFKSTKGTEYLSGVWGEKMSVEVWYADSLYQGNPPSIMAEKLSGHGRILVSNNSYNIIGEYKGLDDFYTSRWPNMGLGTTEFEVDVLCFEEHKLTLAQRAKTYARLNAIQQTTQNEEWRSHNHVWQMDLWKRLRPKQTAYVVKKLGEYKTYTKAEIESPNAAIMKVLEDSYKAPEEFDVSKLPNAIAVTQEYLNAIFSTSQSRQELATAMNKLSENRTQVEKEMVKRHVDILPNIQAWKNIQTALKSAPTSFALSEFNCDEKKVTLPTEAAPLADITHEITELSRGRKVAMGILNLDEMKAFLERSVFLQTEEVDETIKKLRDGME